MRTKNVFFKTFQVLPTALMITVLAFMRVVQASESGSSHYMPGAFDDFFMNAQKTPGIYIRDDMMYYGAKLPNTINLGKNVAVDVSVDAWINIAKFLWVSDFEILGARYGAGLILPIVYDMNIFGNVQVGPFLARHLGGNAIEGQDNRGGMGDMTAIPLSLTWKWQDVSVALNQGVFMPSGFYDENELVNLGRNHWSFDTILGVTWIHPTRGHEISFNVGFMSNTKNAATQYQSGDELHIDYTIAQHFSETFGVGVTGYYYQQLSKDKSPQLDRLQQIVDRLNQLGRQKLLNVGGFQGEALGIGPIVRYCPKFGEKQVHFIGKWIHEFDVTNRLQGEIGMLSVALEL